MTNITLAAEQLTSVNGIAITNSMLAGFVVSLGLIIVSWIMRYQVALVPKGAYNAFEAVIDGLFGLVESITGSFEDAQKYFPLIGAFFLFIMINNWFGLLPGVGSLGLRSEHGFIPLLRGANADLNNTLALAIVSVVAAQYYGTKATGFLNNASRFFNFSSPIMFAVGILEFAAEFSKILSFSFRLFGNIFAGEVLLIVMSAIAPFLGPIPFIGLEIFVGFVQALVFSMLTLVFIKVATASEH